MSRMRGVFYLVMMTNSNWERYLKREHPDFHRALLKQLVACCQQHIFVSEKGRYETAAKKYLVSVNNFGSFSRKDLALVTFGHRITLQLRVFFASYT